MSGRLLAVLVTVAPGLAAAGAPAFAEGVAGWARKARYALSAARDCPGIEERLFGASGSVCWSAKSKVEQAPPGSRMFPRMTITLADYADADDAAARMARFRSSPKLHPGPEAKAYPLRAGFRLGSHVVVVTTDAAAFEGDACRAATELAEATGGTGLTCWSTPDPR